MSISEKEVDFRTLRPLQVREVESGAAVCNETEPPADRVGVPGAEPHWHRAHGEISGLAARPQRRTVGRFDQPARAGAFDPTDAADEAEAGREMDRHVGAVLGTAAYGRRVAVLQRDEPLVPAAHLQLQRVRRRLVDVAAPQLAPAAVHPDAHVRSIRPRRIIGRLREAAGVPRLRDLLAEPARRNHESFTCAVLLCGRRGGQQHERDKHPRTVSCGMSLRSRPRRTARLGSLCDPATSSGGSSRGGVVAVVRAHVRGVGRVMLRQTDRS